MTRTVSFRQSDVERAIKAVQAAGLPVEGVEIVDGRIRVLTTRAAAEQPADDYGNWKRKRGDRAA